MSAGAWAETLGHFPASSLSAVLASLDWRIWLTVRADP